MITQLTIVRYNQRPTSNKAKYCWVFFFSYFLFIHSLIFKQISKAFGVLKRCDVQGDKSNVGALRPRESQPPLSTFKVGRLVQLLDALRVSRHALGHLGAALVVNQVNWRSTPGDAHQTPRPRSFLQRIHVELRCRGLLNELLRVAPEALVLVSFKLRLLLLKLVLFLRLALAPCAFVSLAVQGWRISMESQTLQFS